MDHLDHGNPGQLAIQLDISPEDHPCYYARNYMISLKETHDACEVSFSLRSHLRIASNPYSFRRQQGLRQALALLAKQPPGEYRADASLGVGGPDELPPSPTEGANFVSMTLQSAFPRRDANLIFAGINPEVAQTRKLPQESLLAWSTLSDLPKESGPVGAAAGGNRVAGGVGHGGGLNGPRVTDSTMLEELTSRRSAARDVGFAEQELALRVVQGLCSLYPDQRRHAADGPLVPVVLESINTYQQHLEAMSKDSADSPLAQSLNFVPGMGQGQGQTPSKAENPLHHGAAAAGRGGGGGLDHSHNRFGDFVTSNDDSAPDSARHSRTVSAISLAPTPRGSPILRRVGSSIAPNPQHRVFLAMIDAVEAACHYSPHTVTTFVNLQGIKYFMQFALNPLVPLDLRRAVLHFFSLLVNETQCLDRLHRIDGTPSPNPSREASPSLAGRGGGRPSPAPAAGAAPAAPTPLPAGKGWPNRASASKFYGGLTDWLKNHFSKKIQLSNHAQQQGGGVSVFAGTPHPQPPSAAIFGGGPNRAGTTSAESAAVASPGNFSRMSHNAIAAAELQAKLLTLVEKAIRDLAALVNFTGTAVPSKVSKQELLRRLQANAQKREAAMSDLLLFLERGQ